MRSFRSRSVISEITKVLEGQIFFQVRNTDGITELWKSDGSISGTSKVINNEQLFTKFLQEKVSGGLGDFVVVGKKLFFTMTSGQSLFETDGTELGTKLVDNKITSSFLKDDRISYTVTENGKNTLKIINNSKQSKVILDDEFRVISGNNDDIFLVIYSGNFPIATYRINDTKESLVNLGLSRTTETKVIGQLGSDVFMNSGFKVYKLSGSPEIISRDHGQFSNFYNINDKLIYLEKFSEIDNRIFALEKGVNANPVDCKKLYKDISIKGLFALCGASNSELIFQGSSSTSIFRWLRDGSEVRTYSGIGPQGLRINSPGKYSVTVAFADGCSLDYGPHVVTSNGDLKAGIAFEEGLSLCPQNKPFLPLKGIKIGGTSPFVYTWKLDDQVFQQTSPVTSTENLALVNKEGKYTFLVTDKDNCKDSVSIGIRLGQSLPKPSIASSSLILKLNDNINLSTNASVSSTQQLQWYKNGNKIDGKNQNILTVNEAGRYSVSISESFKCESFSDEIEIKTETVVPSITATITSTTTEAVSPNTIRLTAQTGQGYTYQWQKDGVNISGATAVTYDAKESGTYRVIVTLNGASKTSNEIKVTISTPSITATITSTTTEAVSPNTIKLSAQTGQGYTYQWQKDGVNISGATAVTYDAKESGTYRVIVTLNGASKTSNEIKVTIIVVLSNEPELTSEVNIFPNPSSDIITVSLDKVIINKKLKISIYDMVGKLVKTQESPEKEIQIKVDNLVSGTYIVSIDTGKKLILKKIIKL